MPHSSHPSDAPAPGAILDWLTEALFVVDHDFRCVYVNDSAGRRLGTSRDELLHRDLRELTEDLDNQPVYAACRRAIREQVPRVLSHALSTVVWRTDGRGRPTHVLDWTTLAGHIVRPGEEPVWEEVVHPDDRSALADAWRRSLTTGTELDFTNRLRHADGAGCACAPTACRSARTARSSNGSGSSTTSPIRPRPRTPCGAPRWRTR
jgi:PAS domain S-box-containing protein